MAAPAVERKLSTPPAPPAQGLPQTLWWPITLPQTSIFGFKIRLSFTLDSASTHCFWDSMNAPNTPGACSAAPEFLNRDFEGRGIRLTHKNVPAVLRADLEILNQDFDIRGARPPHLASDNSLELLMNAWNMSVARRTTACASGDQVLFLIFFSHIPLIVHIVALHNPQICRTPHELRMRRLRRAAAPRNSRDLNVQGSQRKSSRLHSRHVLTTIRQPRTSCVAQHLRSMQRPMHMSFSSSGELALALVTSCPIPLGLPMSRWRAAPRCTTYVQSSGAYTSPRRV
ncbi:hypothetical protein C8J57DRAFT_1465715 [Mycena rebaudengoi]|nr:hypothetical protein C8J57DRAFT_1465715 [Mycena rebaudengoi]